MGVVFRLIKLQNIAWFLFIGILSQIGQGQTTNSAQSNKTNQEAIGLLFSPQDRDRAWGAYWIGKNRLRQYIPELQKMLSEIPRGEFSWIHDLTTRAALDSLIQLRAKVPLGELMPFYQRYPDEVLILLAQDAVGNQQGLLALLQEPPPTIRWLGICNLLAGTKAPGFASQMLHEMRIEVTVWVSEAGESGVGRGAAQQLWDVAPFKWIDDILQQRFMIWLSVGTTSTR